MIFCMASRRSGASLAVMELNPNIEAILKHGPSPVLKVLGWVLAVLQAALAAQYIINGLVRLGTLSPL